MAAELGDLLNGVVAEAGDASLLELLPKRIRLYGPQPQPEASSFVGNRVHTHRYTLLNYLPISVCEQLNPFEKFANAYFLFVGCLQAVPQITVTGGVPVLLGPLLFVTGIDAMLKLYEDLQRRKADALTNQQATRVLNPHSGAFEPRRWDELRVGDIVSVRNREIFPADMLLLGADGPEGMTGHVWVSTKSLDGETDAKLREAPKATVQRLVAAGLPALLQLRGHMRCEAPNNITSDFSGLLYLAEPADLELPLASPRGQGGPSTVAPSLADALEVSAVSEDNMLLRGCLLRNTRECYGLVVSCGTQTKIQYAPARRMGAARLGALGRALGGLSRLCVGGSAAGSGHKPASEKVGAMTARVNLDILGIVAILVALSVVGVVLHFAACTALVRAGEDLWYLGVAPPAVQLDAAQREAGDGLCEDGASLFGRYFLLSYNLIPVSLYVSISLVLIWVAMLMANDLGMYDPSQDQPALVRNMSLCDELGRISHVLSDKTGTLTANHMRLRRLTLGEAVYGSGSAINPLSAIKTPKRGPLRAAPRGFAAAAAAQAARDGGGGASAAVARPRSATDSAGSSVVALPPVAGASLREAAERFASPEPPAVIPQAHSQSAHSARSRVGAPDGVADWYGCKRDTAAYVAYEEGEAGGESLYAALDAEVGGARAAQTRRELRLLLLHLASNHSVLHEAVGGMATELAASSPDELAFVAAAEHFGYEFTARDLSKGALLVRDKRQGAASAEHVLDVLAVFPYVSSRKRMTTVVRLPPSLCADGDAGVYVFTKGADSVLLPMLAPPAASAAAAHANSSRRVGALRRTTGRWADEALRTLVFACRLVPEAEVDGWVARLKAAHEDPRERTALKAGLDNAIDRLQQEVEIGLLLQGASAVEDQLQAGVPETLRDLSAAGIKVWMLTGDKVGTAKNIAAACSLLPASCDDADDATLDDEGRASGSARASGKALDVAAEPGAAPSAFVWIVREGSARGAIAATAPGARGRVAPPSHRSRASRPSRRAAELSGTRVVEWTTETVDGLDDVPPSELASASSAVAEATAEANLARARGALRGALDAPYHVLVRARLLRPRPSTLGAAALAARALIEALERKYPALALLSAQCVEEGARLAGAADPAHPSLAPAADSAGSVAGGAAGGADAKPRAAAPTSHTVVLDEKAIDWLAAACPAEFAAFVNTARAVIGCRCRQEQKAQMVRIVRDNAPMARVLAIGDGANDVAMIKAAHVGVGIAGKEGMQAVQNSDFAIGQFRFLRRLLFYHGRHNYRRLALIVYYMFYKNVLDRLCQFYFTAFALYSGQKYWSEVVTTIFNVVYTSLPIIAITIADQDVPAYVAERSAELYRAGSKQLLYTHAAFFSYVLEALVVSLVYFYAIARIFATPSSAQGSSLNVYALGIVAQFSITTVVTLRLALDVTQWTWPIVAVFAFTYLCWFGSLGLFQEIYFGFWSDWAGIPGHVLFTGPHGFFFLFAMVVGLIPKYIREMWGDFFPSETRLMVEAAREKNRALQGNSQRGQNHNSASAGAAPKPVQAKPRLASLQVPGSSSIEIPRAAPHLESAAADPEPLHAAAAFRNKRPSL